MEGITTLVRYERARAALRAAHSVDEARTIRNQATAVETYARQARDRELETLAAEIRLRAERRAGELLAEMKATGQRARRGRPEKTSRGATFSDLGVTRDEASTWQRLAAVPEQAFEQQLAERKAAGQPIYADHIIGKTNGRAAMQVHYSSETPEHYTPQDFLDAVREVFGDIPDLDPCSNSHETPNVEARRHYTAADDGLTKAWRGRVFMNPPYGREIDAWIAKLREEWTRPAAVMTEAIALLPGRIDTKWMDALTRDCGDVVVCHLFGRLTFVGNSDPAPFPSVAVYVGPKHQQFARVFCALGSLWVRPPLDWFVEHE